MRLIDAGDVKKRADCYLPSVRSVVANILSHTKTVKDAVKVVRCGECKHYIGHDKRCGKLNHGVHTNFYCADGDRIGEDKA